MVALAAVTFYVLLKDANPKQLIQALLKADIRFLLLGILAMLGFIGCEALNIKNVMGSIGSKISFLKCYKYSCIAFYYASITPASSGGQPMKLYYMKKDNINLSHSSLAILIIVFVYQIAELGFAFFMFFFKYDFVMSNMSSIVLFFIYGTAFNLVLLVFMLSAVFSKRVVKNVTNFVLKILVKIRLVKNVEKVTNSLNEQISEYQLGAEHIKKNPMVIIRSLFITILQLALSFSVTYFVYLSFGYKQYNLIDILALQSVFVLAVGSLPLPGAVGVSESGFVRVFKVFFPQTMILPAMILTRGITFYVMLVITAIVSIYIYIKVNRRELRVCKRASLN